MANIIITENLSYSCGKNKILDNISFIVEKGTFTSIIGSSGCGKSIIGKALLGIVEFDGNVSISNIKVCNNNISKIKKYVDIVFENPDNQFIIDNVEEELMFILENLNYRSKDIEDKINEIVELLNIKELLKKSMNQLSSGEKQLVSLATILIKEPKVLIIDNAFTMLDGVTKNNILRILKSLKKEKEMTIIFITSNMEDTVYSDKIIVLDNGEIILEGTKDYVYKEEKLLKKIGLNLPFMVDLSNKLSYYGLIDKTMLNMENMVDKLWK